VPTPPEPADSAGTGRNRPRIVARLLPLALMAAAAAVVLTATGQTHAAPRARVAADSTPAVVLPNGQPTLVQIMGANRSGDAILLRVDPVGAATPVTLVVSPGARVVGSSLQELLAAAGDRRSPMHRLHYSLGYDATGAITGIAAA
jgi:hypothetical protein